MYFVFEDEAEFGKICNKKPIERFSLKVGYYKRKMRISNKTFRVYG